MRTGCPVGGAGPYAAEPPRLYTRPEWEPGHGAAADLIDRVVLASFVTTGPTGLAVSHLPFLLDRSRGPHGCLVSHLAAANEHAQLVVAGLPAVVIFKAEQGYISSSWYPPVPVRDSAPTWNFAVVHCHGRPRVLDATGLARHLADLVGHLERDRESAWNLDELGPGGMERRMPHIVGFELPIERLDAKFKMGQDERPGDTAAAIEQLAGGSDPGLAALMRRCNPGLERKGLVTTDEAFLTSLPSA